MFTHPLYSTSRCFARLEKTPSHWRFKPGEWVALPDGRVGQILDRTPRRGSWWIVLPDQVCVETHQRDLVRVAL